MILRNFGTPCSLCSWQTFLGTECTESTKERNLKILSGAKCFGVWDHLVLFWTGER